MSVQRLFDRIQTFFILRQIKAYIPDGNGFKKRLKNKRIQNPKEHNRKHIPLVKSQICYVQQIVQNAVVDGLFRAIKERLNGIQNRKPRVLKN